MTFRTRSGAIVALALAGWAGPTTARAERPADPLLALVAPDAAATLVVENFRDRSRELLASPTFAAVGRLPAVKGWIDSEGRAQFRSARREVEAALGVDLPRLRDEILGDAFVLALHLPAGGDPESARGLLLARPRDRALLAELIEKLNAFETKSGSLVRVTNRTAPGGSYSAREFRPGSERADFYATFDDGSFAWSNSEPLIVGVLGRRGRAVGLGADSGFQAVRDRLPAGALASLHLTPASASLAMAAVPEGGGPSAAGLTSAMGRYLGAIRSAGLALELRDGLVLQSHEAIDPAKLDPWLRRWAARPGPTDAIARRVPPGALAMAVGHFDFASIAEGLSASIPAAVLESNFVQASKLAARGVLLGLDPASEILPRLGPAALAYAELPASGAGKARPTWVAAVGVEPEAISAVANAMRTAAAVVSLASGNDGKALSIRVAARDDGPIRVTTLAKAPGDRVRFAFATRNDLGLVALANAAEAATGFLNATEEAQTSTLAKLRAERFPDALSYACVDMQAVRLAIAEGRWSAIAPGPDRDQALAMLGLFRAAYATSTVAADFASVHRTIGLVAD